MDPIDLALRRYDAILRYLAYENTVYWTRSSFFLAANAGLFGFVASKLPYSVREVRLAQGVAFSVVCISALMLCAIWRRALREGERWITRWEGICLSLEPEAFGAIDVLRNCRSGGDSAKRTAHWAAELFTVLWALTLLFVIVLTFLSYTRSGHTTSGQPLTTVSDGAIPHL